MKTVAKHGTGSFILPLAIFLAALILRLVYIHQLGRTYFFSPFKGGFDDYIFDEWARAIARGNWFGDGAIYIYRMPLYAYFLAAAYALFGSSAAVVYVIQAFLGAASAVIVYLIGSRLSGRAAGAVAGSFVALYGPFLFYAGMLVGEVLTVLIACAAFYSLLVFQDTRRLRHLFLGGVAIGIAMLGRGNVIALFPLLCAWLVSASFRDGAAKTALRLAVFLLAVSVAISPVMIRNYLREKDVVPITALAGLNLYIGNGPGATGLYRVVESISGNAEDMIADSVGVAEKASGRRLKPSEVSAYWTAQTVRAVGQQGIGPFVALVAKKAAIFWNGYEPPDIWDYYFFKMFIPVLRLPLVGYALIVPLALTGAFLAWPRRRDFSLLYVFTAGYMLSLVVVFITSRYRVHAVPFLALFAGYGIVEAWRLLRAGRLPAGAVAVLALSSALALLPAEKISFETSYNSLGILLKREGRIEEAVEAYGKAIEHAPRYPTPYFNLAILYKDTGDRARAVEYLKRAVELAPDFTRAKEKLRELGAQ